MKRTVRMITGGLVLCTITGCASKTDLYMLQDDVKQLKNQTRQTGGESAEVYSEVQQLRDEVSRLKGTIEELRNRVETEPQQPPMPQTGTEPVPDPASSSGLDTVKLPSPADSAAVAVAAPSDSAAVEDTVRASPAPESAAVQEGSAVVGEAAVDEKGLYDAGVGYFRRYNYPAARKEFGLLLENYPSSPLADDAQYYIAETYYNEKWYEKAILEYQLVIEKYKNGDKRPSAYFKQGLAFENIGDSTNAKVRYRELVQIYPDSNEARIVKDKLQ